MLRNLKDLENYAIGANDGPIGHVKDLYFDDSAWVIRYLVVDTGEWLLSRQVLITPMSIRQANWADRLLPVALTKEQVKHSPDIDTAKPVSRQHEADYLGYYGYPSYWGGEGIWGAGIYPYAMLPEALDAGLSAEEAERAERLKHRDDDPHLRSCQAVVGYHLQALDGEIGHVDGFLIDEDTWAIRYLVVNTSNWWMGHQVLIAPTWVTGVNWGNASVSVDLSLESIKTSPPYDASVELTRQREMDLYGHYGRSDYWAGWAEADGHDSAV
jgi:hypothetical protein